MLLLNFKKPNYKQKGGQLIPAFQGVPANLGPRRDWFLVSLRICSHNEIQIFQLTSLDFRCPWH